MILDSILKSTEQRVRELAINTDEIVRKPQRSLSKAVKSSGARNPVIAEVKFRSPGKGQSFKESDAAEIAALYQRCGCAGISVLTEPDHFRGSTDNLVSVRNIASVPVLRKDFIIDEAQIYETRLIGADAVLLIADILGERLPEFVDLCRELGIEPLVEVHNEADLNNATRTDTTLIGINNRNLRTMKIDYTTSQKLGPVLKEMGYTVISESGIMDADSIRSLRNTCDAFLVGSALMSAEEPAVLLEELLCA